MKEIEFLQSKTFKEMSDGVCPEFYKDRSHLPSFYFTNEDNKECYFISSFESSYIEVKDFNKLHDAFTQLMDEAEEIPCISFRKAHCLQIDIEELYKLLCEFDEFDDEKGADYYVEKIKLA